MKRVAKKILVLTSAFIFMQTPGIYAQEESTDYEKIVESLEVQEDAESLQEFLVLETEYTENQDTEAAADDTIDLQEYPAPEEKSGADAETCEGQTEEDSAECEIIVGDTVFEDASLPEENLEAVKSDLEMISIDTAEQASAGDDNEFVYTILADGTAEIVGYTGKQTGALVIPEVIDGYTVTGIANMTFENCSGFTSLTLPDTLKTIGYNAFYDCSGFRGELKLPEGLTHIGFYAFSGCQGFTGELKLPKGLTEIESGVFSQCSNLTGPLVLPEKVTSVGTYAFLECKGFTGGLNLKGIQEIGKGAFCRCTGFDGSLLLSEDITRIEDSTFFGCTGLSGELHLPDSINKIGTHAFSGCRGFTGKLNLPDSINQIGDTAFSGCIGFTGLKLPSNLISIDSSTFYGCTGFTGNLILPEGIKSVGAYAFAYCSFEGSLLLPAGLTDVDVEAFSGCPFTRVENLSEIDVPLPLECAWYYKEAGTVVSCLPHGTAIRIEAFYIGEKMQSSITLQTGEELVLHAVLENLEEESVVFSWESSNTGIAAIDANGKITALREGWTTITATAFGTLQTQIQICVETTYVRVMFDSAGGSMVSSQIIKLGECPEEPVEPVKTDYQFSGWYLGDEKYDFAKPLTENLTLTAGWEKNKKPAYKITYRLNGGKNHKSNPSQYDGGRVKLYNPSRKNYAFKGWYTDKKFKKKITIIKDKKNITVYAKWEKVKTGKAGIRSLKGRTGRKAVLNIKKVSGASGYEILYGTAKNMRGAKKTTSSRTSVTLKNLKKGKTYYVKVRAYKKDSTGRKVYGAYSAVSKAKIK